MESHILNMYHQARYRTIDHKIMRATSESLSSESSCNQNSPEYSQSQQSNQFEEESNEYWDHQDGNDNQKWSQNQTVNIKHSQDLSSDEEEHIDVQEVSIDKTSDSGDQIEFLEPETMEENSLVEGDDYDVIQVFAVDPDLDLLEASSDEEKEYEDCIDTENAEDSDGGEHLNGEDIIRTNQNSVVCHDGLEINLNTPVISNVDEYFIKKDDEKHILEVKDEPVVKDVDEYFIKNPKDDLKPPNIEDFLVKNKLLEEEHTDFRIPKNVPNVDEFFVTDSPKKSLKTEKVEPQENLEQADPHNVSINEADLEVLPNIEELKTYLLDDMPYTKFKNLQKSCSVPHSPMHNIYMDIDAKTCLSFESLNLDLSDLAFENDKDKSSSTNKSEDILRTLTDEDVNSFLITCKPKETDIKNEDDLSHQDMEIDRLVESTIEIEAPPLIFMPDQKCASTPIPKTIVDYCIEKPVLKKEPEVKVELDDFVDVESCHDTAIPVLEANNLSSLLEQFEATEKLNSNAKIPAINVIEPKVKSHNSLTNGMRLQDAGVQLNKTKMRQILMQPTINTTIRRSPSPVHSDHDYCSSKKRHSLPNIKAGQSLLKPEGLSTHNRILNSRHRSCKNKKVVYHLSSDDESEKSDNTKKIKTINNRSVDDIDLKLKKSNTKQTIKPSVNLNCRKKISPTHSALNDSSNAKSNDSVIVKRAYKASDTSCSQNSNGSIKLTIRNKSEVILNSCDANDNQTVKSSEKHKIVSVSEKSSNNIKSNVNKAIESVDSNELKNLSVVDEKKSNEESNKNISVTIKEEHNTNSEHFYTALFSNKQDVQIPQSIQLKMEEKTNEDIVKKDDVSIINEVEQPQKKKKLNLQEYKLRRGVSSNNSSATVSPEAIFPDIPNLSTTDKLPKYAQSLEPTSGTVSVKEEVNKDESKKIFDPIREASRKILMNTKKQKAEAMRKRDEDIVMSKIPKVENLQLQPLISDAEMLKIVGMVSGDTLPVPVVTEKPQPLKDYDEIVMVSIGTNTDVNMFRQLNKPEETLKRKSPTPVTDNNKSMINFKIKKSDHVLKQNVFDAVKSDRSSSDDKKHISSEIKMDKERFKDITATLKSVEKQVETKISSNSLFASIQDTVMKKAQSNISQSSSYDHKSSKSSSPAEKRDSPKRGKTVIVRDFDASAEHGEDKIILHLEKERRKPDLATTTVQTELDALFTVLPVVEEETVVVKQNKEATKKRNDSDILLSNDGSPIRANKRTHASKTDDKVTAVKGKPEAKRDVDRSQSKEKRSRSKDRHEVRYRRSRSPSRNHKRKRSHSRNRSRSRGRYRRYRRSDSPYRRKRRTRSRSRSPYRASRRSPSTRRDYSSNRTRSKSKHNTRSRSPIPKKNPQYNPNNGLDRKSNRSSTLPSRKPTVSESSDTSSSSSSSSSCSSSSSSSFSSSRNSRRSNSYKREDYRKNNYKSPYSSEDRESNAPVEERRIVFVGKLEKDITKSSLRAQFLRFGPITEVRLHTKEDSTRYGFVTFKRQRDAWTAVESSNWFPQYDVGFGGRRDFCRQSYADLDGLEAKYTESAFYGQPALPVRRDDDMSFEQMLLDMKMKLNKRKSEKPRTDDSIA